MTIREFVFAVREYNTLEFYGSSTYKQECIGIVIRDVNKGIDYPSPLTHFIKSTFRMKNQSISTQRNPAYEICKFLNYCRTKVKEQNLDFIELKEKGILGLRRIHASIYISDLAIRSRANELDGNYVRQIIRYLNQFFSWMKSQELLNEDVNFFYKEVNKKPVLINDIFDDIDLGTIYPSGKSKKKTKIVDFGKYRYKLVEDFLDIAERTQPDIYVGVCLQFFGGLRKGEVVNLTKNAFINRGEGYLIDVDDRRNILFEHKHNTDAEQVKVPRIQALLWNNRLKYSLKEHFEKLDSWKSKGKLKNTQAFLVSSNTGNPVSGKVYWERFNEVKEQLLTKLSNEGRVKEYNFLTSLSWSTHLARGVFTNFCFDIGMSLSEVAIARGDSNLSSVLVYVEELAAYESMTEAMNNIRKAFDNKTGKINSITTLKYSNVWGGKSVFTR